MKFEVKLPISWEVFLKYLKKHYNYLSYSRYQSAFYKEVTILQNNFIIDIWQVPKYATEIKNSKFWVAELLDSLLFFIKQN